MTEELGKKTTRKLATIEKILSISPIKNADSIVSARIRGWDVVVKLGEFNVGDTCLYIEVDSFLPVSDSRFEFLAKRGIQKDTNGFEGYLLKTANLRGVYSQGLALPVNLFPEVASLPVGSDVTEALGIVIWEPKIPDELLDSVVGYRPNWIPATDEERIQNVAEILSFSSHNWIATEKIDGTSTTVYVDGYQEDFEGVCSRNYDLLELDGVAVWKLARDLDLHQLIKTTWPKARVAIQGETFGEGGHEGNTLRIKGRRFAAFTLRVNGEELPRSLWPAWLLDIAVPIHDLTFPLTSEQALSDVDSLKSKITPEAYAEGVVWRALDTSVILDENGSRQRASFKVISNRYLVKHNK